MSTIQDVYTLQQAADHLGITGTRVRQMCLEHKIGTKIGHFRFLNSEDIDKLEKIRRSMGKPIGTFTVREAAVKLNLTVSRIRQLCLEHDLGVVKAQTKYLTHQELEFLKKCRRKPGRPKSV